MVELVKDEETEARKRGNEKQTEMLSAAEEAKRLREQRKQEAIERSRQRQANPDYFKTKAELNTPPPETKAVSGQEGENATESTAEDEADEKTEEEDIDPFRSYKPNSRPKVFVK